MKKILLSLLTIASLAFVAHARHNMCVKTKDGNIVEFRADDIKEVYYREITDMPTIDGVTVSGKEGEYSYVDLGLVSGTMWATCNIGASKPADYGDYFVWGETVQKSEVDWSTYKWCDGTKNFMTKYCAESFYGNEDGKYVLEAEDDAATANWGSEWRMPTKEEVQELVDGCEWKWVEDFYGSGNNGMLGMSKKNSATIFLPAAGYPAKANKVGIIGHYWSSSVSIAESNYAHIIDFNADQDAICIINQRATPMSVRPVLK